MRCRINFVTLLSVLISCNGAEEKDTTQTLKNLSSPTDPVSAQPYLFTGNDGTVYLSWIQKIKGSAILKYSILNEDKWSHPISIVSGENWFVNSADYPMIASNGDNLIAHVLDKSDKEKYNYDVKFTTSADKGKSWSDLKVLHDDGKKAEHGFVSLTPYNDGFFVSWLDGRNTVSENATHDGHQGAMSLRAAVMSKDGSKSAEWELDNKVCDCCQTTSAITSNGAVVIYRDRSDDEIRDISIVRYVNEKWTEPKTIFPDNWKFAGCPVNGPRCAAEGNTLAVAWFSSPDKNAQVNVMFSDNGGETFDKPIRIDQENAIGRVDLEMLDNNSAMISWMEGAVIKACRVYKDGKKDAAIIIASSSESRPSGFPQMTKSGNNIILAWSDDKDKIIKVAKLSL